jgi:hypothetical protein
MSNQITKETFERALIEMGHDPSQYKGKRLSLTNLCELYELEEDIVINAIDKDLVSAHYDYKNDIIWIDALDAAHFYYCLQARTSMYNAKF